MFKIFVFMIAFLSCTTIALSQEKKEVSADAAAVVGTVEQVMAETKVEVPAAEISAPEEKQSVDFWTKMMSILSSLYVGMWALGEILTRVSVWTENKWDNKAAGWFSQATWFLGAFAGRMGWKLPKLVIEHEADKIAQKDLSKKEDS